MAAKGRCPKCKGNGYVTKYGDVGARPFGVFAPAAPIVGLKTCPLCEGSREVEIEEI